MEFAAQGKDRKLNANRITLICSISLFSFTLWAKLILPGTLSAHNRYYLTAILTISGLLIVITFFRMIRHSGTTVGIKKIETSTEREQRRSFYRIHFGSDERPLFIQRRESDLMGSDVTFPVSDISETGISLVCSDVYHLGETVMGEVIFQDGATATINGDVIRQPAGLTVLQLHCTIEPSLLMKIQRSQIERRKKLGHRPPVDRILLDQDGKSLPSHAPKGVCRMKRS